MFLLSSNIKNGNRWEWLKLIRWQFLKLIDCLLRENLMRTIMLLNHLEYPFNYRFVRQFSILLCIWVWWYIRRIAAPTISQSLTLRFSVMSFSPPHTIFPRLHWGYVALLLLHHLCLSSKNLSYTPILKLHCFIHGLMAVHYGFSSLTIATFFTTLKNWGWVAQSRYSTYLYVAPCDVLTQY